jgi:Flp pilus assembly protein TadG
MRVKDFFNGLLVSGAFVGLGAAMDAGGIRTANSNRIVLGKSEMNEFNQRHQRRAATAVFVAVLLPVLIMCAALSVDVGHLTAVVAEMQHTADGASLAGATALWEERWDEVSDRSVAVIDPMQRSQGFSSLDDQLIEVGRWNWLNNTFTAYPFADAAESNAVRVVSRRAETPYFFARFMRKMSADVRREAVAVISEPCGGIWGLEGVKVPGSVSIDSFDSTDGPYSPATAGSDGDVCSGRLRRRRNRR